MIYIRKSRKDKPRDTQIYVCLCVSKFNEHKSEFYQLAAYDKEADKWTCETKVFTVVGWLLPVSESEYKKDIAGKAWDECKRQYGIEEEFDEKERKFNYIHYL